MNIASGPTEQPNADPFSAGQDESKFVYDTRWYRKFQQARSIVRQVCPARLVSFDRAFDALDCSPNFCEQVITGLLNADELSEIRSQLSGVPMDALEWMQMQRMHRALLTEPGWIKPLHVSMLGMMEQVTGEKLISTYAQFGLYFRGGKLPLHLDSPNAKWTLDICLGQSQIWPIQVGRVSSWREMDFSRPYMESWADSQVTDPANGFKSHDLKPGDALILCSSSQWHCRQQMSSDHADDFCTMLFLSYAPKGTEALLDYTRWDAHFDIPELAVLRLQ